MMVVTVVMRLVRPAAAAAAVLAPVVLVVMQLGRHREVERLTMAVMVVLAQVRLQQVILVPIMAVAVVVPIDLVVQLLVVPEHKE
jgi:hypothetical protein